MIVRAYAFSPGNPPEEIQLWNVGDNPTDYGVHRWTEHSVAVVGGEYERRGNPLLIDIDHNCSEREREARRAAGLPEQPEVTGGYAHLEIRSGAPFLRFDWSELGAEQIRTRQRLFLSPEYGVDENGVIVSLVRVSLVGEPGTHYARQLASMRARREFEMVLASAKRVRAERTVTMDLKLVLAAIRAALAAEDPAVTKESLTNLLAELEKSDAGPESSPGETMAEGEPPAPNAEEQKVASNSDMEEKVSAGSDKEEEKPVAAKAAKPAMGIEAKAALQALEKRMDAVERDALIKAEGHRLPESIRAWASRQPSKVVRSLLDAAPAGDTKVERVAATRGSAHVTGARPTTSSDPRLDAAFGGPTQEPIRREPGKLVLATMDQKQARAVLATRDGGAK